MTAPEHRSVTGKRWMLRAEAQASHHEAARALGLEPWFAPILAHRGLETAEQATAFMQPRMKNLPDPSLLSDMERAVSRLVAAIEAEEPIGVFGDYDVDGITSSALLFRYFEMLGVPLRGYIPDRLTEGYGPNAAALEKLAEEGIKVLLTVDCGISAHEALTAGKRAGLDVIVTDHHQAGEELPPAHAVINPNRLDDAFPDKGLAGVGVAFYLAMALNRALRRKGFFANGRREPPLKELLYLVAVGTVADVAPLSGINRPLVGAGLRGIAESEHTGLRALMESAGVKRPLSAGKIGFQLGPRLNAGGRLGQGFLGFELLTTADPERAKEIAFLLENSNRERQVIEKEILREAIDKVDGEKPSGPGLVVAGEGWHPGVIGIVASRLAEKYYRPTVVIAWDDAGQGKGSARSISGVNLFAAVSAGGHHLLQFGGHPAAAGMSLARENLEPFTAAFNQALEAENDPALFIPAMKVDTVAPLAWAGPNLMARLDGMEPFGQANPRPVFVLEGVRVAQARVVGESHVKVTLGDGGGRTLEAICFGCHPGALGEALLSEPGQIDVAGTLGINSFRGRETVQLTIKDARLC